MKTRFLFTIILLTVPYVLLSQSYVPEFKNDKIKVDPKIEIQAYAFNVADVKLLGSGPFQNAMDKDAAYLKMIEPDRLLHRFHLHAGLPVKGEIYGGWESEGLSGHTLGHYLSACALFYANTGQNVFKDRVSYIVDEWYRCQLARKNGYVGAIPNEDTLWGRVSRGEIKSGGFDLNGSWAPWYTVHKIMAGLVDAYVYCGNQQALKVVIALADWTAKTVDTLTEEKRLKMLNCEYGGMNEVLANIYAITGNQKYLDLSYKFHDEFVLGQLARGIDPMAGKHSNTNVPKAVGAARRYELTGNASDLKAASLFWELLAHHHAYVIGGNSNYEYLGEPDKLNDRLSDNTCETCNSYNLLKLTRHLYALDAKSSYFDFYERTLFNHILSSQNPEDGMMCYFTPLRMGTHKEFSDQFNTFTCCVGSGMENHSKYAEAIYAQTKNQDLFVNLFIPSVLNWKNRGIVVTQQTGFPLDEKVLLSFEMNRRQAFTIFIRKPAWVQKDAVVYVNGSLIKVLVNTSGYIEINRAWETGDVVTVIYPMSLYTESMPDNPNRIAFLYGPVVLAADLGDSMPDPVLGTPVLLTENHNITDWIKPLDIKNLIFKSINIGKPSDIILKPFYKVYNTYYSVYFDYFSESGWDLLRTEYEADKRRRQKIESLTIDNFRIGEMQPERDHSLVATEKSYVDVALGRAGREARRENSFSFEMSVSPGILNKLMMTYIGDDKDRKFDILVEGQKIAVVEWNGGETGRFYDVEYVIPEEVIGNKTRIIVKIDACYNKTAGRIFGCRILRAKP